MEKEKGRQEEMMQEERYEANRTAMGGVHERDKMMSGESREADGMMSGESREVDGMMSGESREADGTTPEEKQEPGSHAVSETWAEETIADLDDFIESQGIYIRQ